MDPMAEAGKSALATLGNPSVSNVIGGTNLGVLVVLGMLLRDVAQDQVDKAEATQTAVARVEVKVESMTSKFDTLETEIRQLKEQIKQLKEQGASVDEMRAAERRIKLLEDCIRDRRRCGL